MSDRSSTTSTSYDSYHKLLGISPQDQPPTAYRLLGIDLFEGDREVIDAAANKQMSYLRDCCNGEHAASAEQLLNEVVQARLRLLNAESKQQYDSELQAILDSYQEAAAAGANTPAPSAAPVVRVASRRRKKRSGGIRFLIAVLTPGVVCTLVAWNFGLIDFASLFDSVAQTELNQPTKPEAILGSDQGAIISPTAPNPPTSTLTPAATSQPSTHGTQPDDSSAQVAGMASPPSSPEPRSQDAGQELFFEVDPAADSGTMASSQKQERLEAFRAMGQNATSSSGGSLNRDQFSGSRISVPDSELEDARRTAEKAMASKIREAQSSHEKRYLGTVCYALALESGRPAEKFAMMQLAKNLFVDASDCTGAMVAFDSIESRFEVDLFKERVSALTKLIPTTHRPSGQVAAADRAEALIAKAIQRDDYDAALDLAASGKKLASEFRNISMTKKFEMHSDNAILLQKAQPMVQAARERLETEPGNVKAIEYLGRFLCFGKADWDAGLPFLRRAENPALAGLAEAELQGSKSADAFDELGNLWWELSAVSQSDQVLNREGRLRAVHWYQKAIANGLKGLTKAAAQSRIDQLESGNADELAARISPNLDMREPSPPRGVPPEAIHFDGNWYLFSQKKLLFPEAVAIATRAGGRLVVVRSDAECDFLVEHANKRPLLLGMLLKDGVWYDSLGEKQHFFRWNTREGQPEPQVNEPIALIPRGTDLWHDHPSKTSCYFAIEWGKE